MKDLHPTSEHNLAAHYGRLVSYSLPCPDVTMADFLAQAHGQPRFYWDSFQDGVTFAGLGTAIELTSWSGNRYDNIQHQAQQIFDGAILLNPDAPTWTTPRLFGGFAFLDDFTPDHIWWGFAPAYFVLPHYQLVRLQGETWLTINANIPLDESLDGLDDELALALNTKIQELQEYTASIMETVKQAIDKLSYPMSYDTWAGHVNAATSRMSEGKLNKVVLSRIAEVSFKQAVNIDSALDYLASHYQDTYRFLFEPRSAHAFYGATPELLVQTQGKHLKTMALAGSIGRGATPEEDQQFGQILMDSEKDRYEHQVVIDRIQDHLTPLTAELHIDSTRIMTLSNIQHIHTPITGTLKSDDGVLSVLRDLHPTPALGGDPQAEALKFMTEIETVPRGWYGAPIGWIDYKLDGQFSVAIRSAVTQDRRVWMYAGAGIVEASDPLKEWQEIALKFRPMLNALGIDETVMED